MSASLGKMAFQRQQVTHPKLGSSKTSTKKSAQGSKSSGGNSGRSFGSHTRGSDKSKTILAKYRHDRLFKKRNEVRIIDDGEEVNPDILKPLAQGSLLEPSSQGAKSGSHMETGDGVFSSILQSSLALQTYNQSFNVSLYGTCKTPTSSLIRSDEINITLEESLSWLIDSIDNQDEVTEVKEKTEAMIPNRVNITLTETPVMYIYEMTSVSAEKGSEEGDLVETENERYDFLTIGKGRNRKTTPAEIQTNETVLKTRSTQAERYKRKNSYSFASGWDMLDTYEGISEVIQGKTVVKKFPEPNDPEYQKHQEQLKQELLSLMQNTKFQKACIVMERILANNVYNEQQKRFRGLIEQDPFRPDVEFKYNINLLWTFKNDKTEGHPVTAMHWNPANKDILAVGYGKFFYSDVKNGFVFIWNIKNPTQPEREVYYNRPVTSVAFSVLYPNILAVGLYDGSVEMLDISARTIKVIAITGANFSPSHDPIWQVAWLDPDDYSPEDEMLVCAGEDGRILRLMRSKTIEFFTQPLMKTVMIEGSLRGVYQPRHCPVTDVPLSKCAGALLIVKHPEDRNRYFVGTDEGTVHRCSKHFVNQHIDMFLAHYGPVYAFQFSPFCYKLFLTCGADWCINIWTEALQQPLITLTKTMEAVEDACWSPANSTIIASIVGQEIFIWDIQRRLYLPTAVHKSPTNSRNTLVQFTESGKNLVVADVDGNVHIFSLEDMPFPPFYQSEMLINVIKKQLVTKTDIMEQLDSLRQSF